MKDRSDSVETYLSALPPNQRGALERLRRTLRAAVPRAEECISYRLPTLRLDGKMLVAFGATPNHCALYLMSTSMAQNLKDDLEGYDTSKGTIRFPPDQPIPAALVKKLVRARIAENASPGPGRKKGGA